MVLYVVHLKVFCGLLTFLSLLLLVSTTSEPGVPHIPGEQDACSGHICLHGGVCNSTSGQPVCACVVGFVGSRCETVISAPVKAGACPNIPADSSGSCAGDVCSNDAVCPDSQKCCRTNCDTKVCIMPDLTPALPSVCGGYMCLNGGTCRDDGGKPVCHCLPGFSGGRCEETISELVKVGSCPPLPMGPDDQCPGTVCANDAVCPGTQKCCRTGCSTNVCADPLPARANCDMLTCPAGSSCLVVRSSANSESEATCVFDADRTCWASGYARAYLAPSSSQVGVSETVPCGHGSPQHPTCPQGSACSWAGVAYPRICCSGQLGRHQYQNYYRHDDDDWWSDEVSDD